MSVKEELDHFFDKFLKEYSLTPNGLPTAPRRNDVDQSIYVGEADKGGWCKWKPIRQPKNKDFESLLDFYHIKKNNDIIEYFSTYFFSNIDAIFKSHKILLSANMPDGFKRLKRILDGLQDGDTGTITYIPIGIEHPRGYTIAIDVNKGAIVHIDDETEKKRKIAPNLASFLHELDPDI